MHTPGYCFVTLVATERAMSAWIEGDVTFVGDENASETTERLHQWASEHCKKAVRKTPSY